MGNKNSQKKFISLRSKMFRVLVLVALVTELLVLAAVSVVYWRTETRNFYTRTGQSLNLLADSISANLSEFEQGVVYKVQSSTVFSDDYDFEEDGEYTYQRNVKRLANLFKQSNLPLHSIYCTDRSGWSVYYHDSDAFCTSFESYRRSDMFRCFDSNRREFTSRYGRTWFYCFPDSPERIYIVKNILDPVKTVYLGTLVLEVDQSYIRDFYSTLEENYGCSIAIYTADGELLSADRSFYDTAVSYAGAGPAAGEATYGNYLVTEGKANRNRWRIVAFESREELLRKGIEMLPLLAVLSLLIFAVSLLLARQLGLTQTRTIYAIIRQIRQIRAGDPASLSRIDVESNDETMYLEEEFNGLLNQLNEYMQRIAYASVEKDRAEYNALMAQMDPHFLYNTLEGISSLARLHGDRDIVECVNRLSKLYRASVHGRSTEIPLSQEISYAESYLELEKMVTGGRIETAVEADEEVRTLYVPKLIVQPIVENSIRHGVESLTEGGMVIVTAMIRDGDLCIDVSDNGHGMSEEQIRELLSTEEKNAMHVGIRSVQRRIQILYGEQYGLKITSGPEGTTVTIHLPVIRKNGEKETEDS